MRILSIFVLAALVTEAAAECATDECLQALQNAPVSLREEDCKSFVRVTVTSATSTIFSSFTSTTTGTTTRTTTHLQTVSSSTEPSKRWLQQHEVLSVLLGRAKSSNGPVTARATAIPAYASQCGSSAAYESACSCLGVFPMTITAPAPTPITTQVLQIVESTTFTTIHTIKSYLYVTGSHNSSSQFGNSTSSKFGNSTRLFLNATGLAISSSSGILSSPRSALKSNNPTTSSGKYRLKSPSIASFTSSTRDDSVFATTSSTISPTVTKANTSALLGNATNSAALNATTSVGKFLNSTIAATRTGAPSASGFHSGTIGTTSIISNITSSALFLNSTEAAFANTTNAAQFPNSTISAPFMNITSAPSLKNSTAAPFLNTTLAPFLNATHTPLAINATTTAPFLNSTSTVRFANTTTTTTPTPTATRICETASNPFAVRVSQPGGLFDGWYLQLSGDGVIFNPSIDRASKFSFDSQDEGKSHLCSFSGTGLVGNSSAVVAIAENRTDATGSAVYFVDPEVLEVIDNDQHQWYAPLECNGDSGGNSGSGSNPVLNSTTTRVAARSDSTLACAQGNKEYWVGCGLGLDITSDGDGVAVVNGWNCTAVTLSIEYAASS
ncbi:hypothetical protein F4776DRAFT_264299 [Hypoxylon sp. NC0597]|nr:hypothetical protein F4776DRAFT_264299 [Hypoxylon sp. NC0597]